MSFGYAGRILRVDLTTGRLCTEEPPADLYRRYFGGRALIAAYLLREVPPGIDALSPENVIVFAPGVVTGFPISGQGRSGVGAKSPLTGGFGNAEAGGFFGAELKQAGFDAIVISGQSPRPVFLWVHEGEAELRDATALWGLSTLAAHDRIADELGSPGVRTALIGPAGERLVRYANVAHDCSHFAGRTGLGAVMGSKRLKGVAARAGRGMVRMANPALVQEVARWLAQNRDMYSFMHDLGTSGDLMGLNLAGGLPTRNFASGSFAGAEAISGPRLRDTILVGRGTCHACAVQCKRIVEVQGSNPVDPRYGGPEYETLAALGSNLCIDDLPAIAKANELCAAYGLDTISTGATIAFAMECFERGLLTTADTDGLELRFGNTAAALELIHRIGQRQGLGDLLAEGSYRAAQRLGHGAEDYAIHVKGQELPMHEPRLKAALGVGYTVSPTGADHMHNLNDDFYTQDNRFMLKVRAFGEFEPQPIDSLGPEKMRIFYYEVNWRHFLDSATLCYFLPYDYHQIAQIVNGITGWDTDPNELLQVGIRAATLAQVFNCREGIGPESEKLPKRFYEPFASGPLQGVAVDPARLEEARLMWYRAMGWDPATGWPAAERLQALGEQWAAAWLPKGE